VIFLFAALIGIYLLFSIVLAIGIYRLPISKKIDTNFPYVSVLVSCRNEERDVKKCIDSLIDLDYPKDKLQVILNDDFSTDSTLEILKDASSQHTYIEACSSSDFPTNHLEAKARGIANAATKATGEWLFITDADCEVPNSWLRHMLDGVTDKTGIITGAMDTRNDTFIGVLERIASGGRLLFGFGLSGYGLSFHALGPNMAIRHSVYKEGGGLEKADFRIAEDIALFKLSHNLGYKTKYHFDEFTRVITSPVSNLDQLHSQQIRWLKGGFEGEKSDLTLIFVIFILELIFFPMLLGFIYLFIADIATALQFLLIKILSESIMAVTFRHRLKVKRLLRYIPIAVIYTFYIYTWLPLVPLIKKNTEWKGEDYEVKYD